MPTHRWRRSRTPSILVDLNLTLGAGTMSHLARVQTRPTRVKTCRERRASRVAHDARRGVAPSPARRPPPPRGIRAGASIPDGRVGGPFVPRLERPPPPPPPPRTSGAPGTLPSPPLDPHPPLLSFDVARELLDARDAGVGGGRHARFRHHHVPLSPRRRRPPRPLARRRFPPGHLGRYRHRRRRREGALRPHPGAPAERFQAFSRPPPAR